MRSRPRSIATIALALAVCVAPGSVAPAAATAATTAAGPRRLPRAKLQPAPGAPAAAAHRRSCRERRPDEPRPPDRVRRRAQAELHAPDPLGGVDDARDERVRRSGRPARAQRRRRPTGSPRDLEPDRGRRRGQPDDRRPDAQRAARRDPAGRGQRRRSGSPSEPRPARRLAGVELVVHRTNGALQLYRWLPWISRATPFDRPNHGDPFVTVSSPSVRVRITTDRALRLATSGRRIATDGLNSTWLAENVRDFNRGRQPELGRRSRNGRSGPGPGLRLPRRERSAAVVPRRPGDAPLPGAHGARTRTRRSSVAETGGGSGMESPGLIWIPRGLGAGQLPWLVSHETAHQWFYSLVGNDQARQPFADEAMADFLARDLTGTQRASRCATATLDRSIYRYSKACYFETVYVQGGRVLDALRQADGRDAVLGRDPRLSRHEPVRAGWHEAAARHARCPHAARPRRADPAALPSDPLAPDGAGRLGPSLGVPGRPIRPGADSVVVSLPRRA